MLQVHVFPGRLTDPLRAIADHCEAIHEREQAIEHNRKLERYRGQNKPAPTNLDGTRVVPPRLVIEVKINGQQIAFGYINTAAFVSGGVAFVCDEIDGDGQSAETPSRPEPTTVPGSGVARQDEGPK